MLTHFTYYSANTVVPIKSHEAEIRPESDEVAVGEDGVGFGELLIDERHDGLQLRLVLV